MLKTWPGQQRYFHFEYYFAHLSAKGSVLGRMSNLACMSGPLQCRLHFAKSVGDMSPAQHAACSINHAACSIMTVPMFTDNTDRPLRSGWRSCCLAPQHLALTGLLTSRGGQFHCAMWSPCHSPFSSVSAAPSPVSSSSSKYSFYHV